MTDTTLSYKSSPPAPHRPPGAGFNLARWLDIIGPTLALLGIFLFFYVLIGPNFATFFNLQTILRQSTVTCMAALGATFIIIAGGIDLSVGSSVGLAAMVIAKLLNYGYQDPAHPDDPDAVILYLSLHPILWPLFCAFMGVVVGCLCGLFNGCLVTALRLVPFIVTLGTMMIYRGLTELTSVVSVNAPPNWVNKILAVPDLPTWADKSPIRGLLQWIFLAPGIWMTILCAIIMAILLRYFRFGRYAIAIGSNEQTARLCGIPVNRTKIMLYLIGGGLFAGLAGIMQYARQHQGSPAGAVGLELDVIAACVIGGASLNGGKGSVMGTLIGALIMNVINNGCSQIPIPHWFPHWLGQGTGLPSSVQKIVTGLIIIVAVTLDNLRQRRPR